MRRVAAALIMLLVAACQPAGAPSAAPSQGSPARDGRRAPERGVPQTLDELVARVEPAALEWQDEPHLAEVSVALGADGSWTQARAVSLAAGADRLLTGGVTPDGLFQQRTTRSTLGLQPVSGDGRVELPARPDDVAEPRHLVAAAEAPVAACDAGPVVQVLYATGAPVSWDGQAWSVAPEWTATLTDAQGAGATVDPAGDGPVADPCIAAPPQ